MKNIKLTSIELENAARWKNSHICKKPWYSFKDLKPKIVYCLESIHLGYKIELRCKSCGEIKDITDYEYWL